MPEELEMNEELQHSRLDVRYKPEAVRFLRGVSGKQSLNRDRTYGMAMSFAKENEEQFKRFVEERDC